MLIKDLQAFAKLVKFVLFLSSLLGEFMRIYNFALYTKADIPDWILGWIEAHRVPRKE